MSDTAELTDGEKALSAPIGLPDIPLAFYIRDVERIVAQRERAAFTAGRATAYTEIADELAKPHWSSWVETPLIRSWLRARATDLRALVAAAEQADKGEAKRKWRKGRLDLPAVPVGELHDSDASKCRRPNCESMHYSHLPATDPTVLKDEATKGREAPRVPVNDEAEAGDQLFRDLATEYGFHAVEDMFEALRGFRAARGEDA